MRKLAAHLYMSLDGVIEAPEAWVRPEMYADFSPLIGAVIAEQDSVLLGRKTYADWAVFWPGSDIQPFADFINPVPKFVISTTLASADWHGSTILPGPLATEIARLKAGTGGTIGVHGSIGLVQWLLAAGLLDTLHLTLCPVIVGAGRRLAASGHDPVQLDLVSAHTTPTGLQFLTYRPCNA